MVRAEHEEEHHRAAEDREEGHRLRDDHAQLLLRSDRHPREDRIQHARDDDRLDEGRIVEEAVRRGIPTDVLRGRHALEHDEVDVEVESADDEIRADGQRAPKHGDGTARLDAPRDVGLPTKGVEEQARADDRADEKSTRDEVQAWRRHEHEDRNADDRGDDAIRAHRERREQELLTSEQIRRDRAAPGDEQRGDGEHEDRPHEVGVVSEDERHEHQEWQRDEPEH